MLVDDRDLMLAVQSGSREAFEELVARYEQRLITYFFRQAKDRDIAEDCAQEVFVRLFRARARYGPQAQFSTFLFTIARNLWIDAARARRARPVEVPLEASGAGERRRREPVAPEGSRGEEGLQRREDLTQLERAIEQLPSGQRDALWLGVIEQLPYAEVGKILGIPVGTVKSRVHAAVGALRRALGDPAAQIAGTRQGKRRDG